MNSAALLKPGYFICGQYIFKTDKIICLDVAESVVYYKYIFSWVPIPWKFNGFIYSISWYNKVFILLTIFTCLRGFEQMWILFAYVVTTVL